jgi:nitrate/TMAO reductase-like tetraheme cytochrome c subunit
MQDTQLLLIVCVLICVGIAGKFDFNLVAPLEATHDSCNGHHLNRPVSRSLFPQIYNAYGHRDRHCHFRSQTRMKCAQKLKRLQKLIAKILEHIALTREVRVDSTQGVVLVHQFRISSSPEKCYFLACNTMQTGKNVSTFLPNAR